MQAQRTTIAGGKQGFYRVVLALFIVRDIAGHRLAEAFAVSQHAGQGQQFVRQRHLTQAHGGKNDAVRTVGEEQVDHCFRPIVRKHIDHKAVPAVGAGRFFDRQGDFHRKGRGDGIQRQHADGAGGGPRPADLFRRQVGDVVGFGDGGLHAGQRLRLEPLRGVQRP